LYDEADPTATGYATTPQECEVVALALEPTARTFNTHLAAGHHRKLCVQRRMQKTSNSTIAAPRQFLYTDHVQGDMWDGVGDWLYSRSHRIIKMTKRSIFVEKGGWRPEGTWRDFDVESYRLDRAELEATGEVWSRQAGDRFHAEPYEQRRQLHRQQYLVDLGLPAGATKNQIEAQFRRLVKVHHPDCGGDAESFKRIRAAYQEAITQVAA
jgi:hypothetical protein